MKFRLDSVFVSSVLLTICLVSLLPAYLSAASTWQERTVMITSHVGTYNARSLIGFASVALILIGLIVIWTGYIRRQRSAWFIMAIFVSVYFVPLHQVDFIFEEFSRMGWVYWSALIREAREGLPFASAAVRSLMTLTVMLIALLLPIRAFFGRRSIVGAGASLSETEPAVRG